MSTFDAQAYPLTGYVDATFARAFRFVDREWDDLGSAVMIIEGVKLEPDAYLGENGTFGFTVDLTGIPAGHYSYRFRADGEQIMAGDFNVA